MNFLGVCIYNYIHTYIHIILVFVCHIFIWTTLTYNRIANDENYFCVSKYINSEFVRVEVNFEWKFLSAYLGLRKNNLKNSRDKYFSLSNTLKCQRATYALKNKNLAFHPLLISFWEKTIILHYRNQILWSDDKH